MKIKDYRARIFFLPHPKVFKVVSDLNSSFPEGEGVRLSCSFFTTEDHRKHRIAHRPMCFSIVHYVPIVVQAKDHLSKYKKIMSGRPFPLR